MFRIGATSSSRGIHSPQQALEIANLCLENAHKQKDPELALELCGDAEAMVSQMTRIMKKSVIPPNHPEEQTIRKGIATVYLELGKLQDGLGHGDKARTSLKNAETWG